MRTRTAVILAAFPENHQDRKQEADVDKALLESVSQKDRDFYQAKVREVNEAILEEIRKALNKLFEIAAFPPVYKDFPGDIDYETFVKKLGVAMEREAPFGLLWAIKDFDAEKSLSETEGEKTSLGLTDIFEIFRLFLSAEYKPPEEIAELVRHLGVLFMLYKADVDMQSYFITAHLSLVFGKLIAAVTKLNTISLIKGDRELKRIKRTTKAKKEESEKRKALVIAIYEHGEAIALGSKLHKVCTLIRKQFEESRGQERPWGIISIDRNKLPTPSLDSIGRWLKEAGILNRDFKEEGKYWIKQM
jgi:hypothetical protein